MKRLTRSALCRFSVGVAGVFLAGFVAIGTAWAQAGQPASVSQTPTVVKEGLRLNQQELAEAQQRVATESGGVAKSTTITRTPVYRFYNTTTTAHFYTASVSERNTVQSTMPNMVYEGAAFDVSSSNSAGLSPVYRFYNQSNGVHFYTISEAEKNHLLANAPSMRLDGVVYYASQVAGPAFRPLYRFYVPSRGFHFYTVSDNEKNSLIASNPNYLFEGVAYYVLGSPQPPSVGLTAPAAGATFTAPASITLTANADDLDGWVTSVAFYSGTALLGTDTTAPYSSNWNNVPAGTYSITARATDNSGVVTASAAVTVTVMVNAPANQPPSVSLSAPGAGASFTAPATVGISANAADSDGSIASVAFYSGSTLLGTDTSAPYSYSWNNVAAGSYSVTARATDNNGAVTTSAAVSFTVGAANSPPIIEWYIPTDGALIGDSPLHMEVGASDPDGSIVRVEFYDNGTLLGTVENPPYFYGTGGALSAGQHTLYAIAYDNQGASTTSAAVSVTGAGSNSPPMVNLISPLEGAVYLTSSTVQLEANATDPDGDNTIASVSFYNGNTLIGSDNLSPYSFSWTNVPAGTYSLTALATDSSGLSTTSEPLSVTVQAASGETVTYIHTDISGSPLAATNASGNLVWKENYSAYGVRNLAQPGSEGQKQWFHGKEVDASTGLQYFGARYYDPAIGRFMGVDPVGFQEDNLHSFNRYAYGNNNPVRYLDPDGNYADLAIEALSLAVGLDSLRRNFSSGNYGASAVDALGVAGDTALAFIPGVPGGIGLGIKASREAGEIAARQMSREQRWLQLANEQNSRLPKEVVDHINRHGGRGVSDRFGLELAHQPKKAAAQGYDYSQTIPKTAADHRGIQHRYLRERSTGTSISIPKKSRSGGALDLPPPGALP